MKEYIVSVDDDDMDYEEVFIAYIKRQKELIRCKDCEDYKAIKKGGFHHYCETIGCVVFEDDFCCWAERKNQRRKEKTE